MKNLTIEQIVIACNGKYIGKEEDKSKIVKNIAIDSRKVIKDTLFIAIKGERVDGHDYIEQVYEKDAICTVSEKVIENHSIDKPYIVVESTLQAIKDIAQYYRTKFDIPFIGITGSVGKTSTKEMIYAVLSQKYKVAKTQGNFNNEIGVPLTIFSIEDDSEIAVIEMGISDFGEMERLSKIVRPEICVITNIGECHLENLKDKDGVLKAKTEMFKYRDKKGEIYLNGDDEKLRNVGQVEGKSPIFYGLSEKNKYKAHNIVNSGLSGIDCVLENGKEEIKVHIGAIGNYMINNSLCAYAIGKQFNMSEEEIIRGIASYKTVGSRANIIKSDNEYTIIDDCYNANPVSVKSAIDTLINFDNRKVAIIGDMKELGENEEELHSEVGRYIDKLKIDVVIGVGKLSKKLIDSISSSEKYWFADTKETNKQLKSIIKKGDIILVKGSRSMKLEQIVENIK